jgi:hypothetical protein
MVDDETRIVSRASKNGRLKGAHHENPKDGCEIGRVVVVVVVIMVVAVVMVTAAEML